MADTQFADLVAEYLNAQIAKADSVQHWYWENACDLKVHKDTLENWVKAAVCPDADNIVKLTRVFGLSFVEATILRAAGLSLGSFELLHGARQDIENALGKIERAGAVKLPLKAGTT